MSDVRVYVAETGRKGHRVTQPVEPSPAAKAAALIHAAAVKKAYFETHEACQCEHVEHFVGIAHPYLGVPGDEQYAIFVGEICLVCATGHLADAVLH